MIHVCPQKLVVAASLILASVSGLVGCQRQFYRRQADQEVYHLLDQKNQHIARPSDQPLRIDVDRRSRMFNPFDVDFQPMPLDDPASYRYMQCVDGRRGYPMWEAAGVTNTSESPDWWQFLPLDEDGVLVINSDTAVRLALLESPEYQRQRENLYLSALAVSAQRFQFDTQFFGGAQAIYTSDGPRRNGGTESSSTVLFGPFSNGRRPLAMQRQFATGADLVVGLANSIVWELSGPNTQSATTLLDFSLVQPLLRNAGRDVVLEQLTFAERTLLANVRAFERYRRSFYLNITTGRSLESRPGINGPAFADGGPAFGAGGFLGLLQSQLQIRNSEENIARLQESLVILEDSLVESLTQIPDNTVQIVQDRLQVEQTRSNLLNSQSSLVNQQNSFQRSIDQFMFSLGLPPYLCVRIEDPILDSFELIDRDLRSRREELSALRSNVGAINVAIISERTLESDGTAVPEPRLEWTPTVSAAVRELRDRFEPLIAFNDSLIGEDLPRVKQDIAALIEALPGRRAQNEALLALYRAEGQQICSLLSLSGIDESVFDISGLDELGSQLSKQFEDRAGELESYRLQIQELYETLDSYVKEGPQTDDPAQIAQRMRDDLILPSQELLSLIGENVLGLQLIQARARVESVVLPEVDLDQTTAVAIARRNRRDWANARADLVNQWRLIEVNADDLESSLDVIFSGDVQNLGDDPSDLRIDTGRLRVALQWDAPITRLIERNNYRSTLIDFERAKRDFYTFEDSIWQQLRSELRQLQANQLNFELGRQQVRVAAAQIELNEDRRTANEARGQSLGPTAARDNIDALNGLLNAQNGLLNTFVNNEVVRRGLYLDLGTMELTPEGLWIDPGRIDADLMLSLDGTSGGMIDCNRCNDCCLPLRRLPEEPTYGLTLDNGMVTRGTYVDGDYVEGTDAESEYETVGPGLYEPSPLDAPVLEPRPLDLPPQQPLPETPGGMQIPAETDVLPIPEAVPSPSDELPPAPPEDETNELSGLGGGTAAALNWSPNGATLDQPQPLSRPIGYPRPQRLPIP